MDITIILIAGIAGALCTFYINNQVQLGGVMASAGISVIAGGFFYLFPEILNPYLTANLPWIIMGSSFIGMATSRVIGNSWIVAISGLIFSLIFLFTGSVFQGYGGGLGTTAAISLCAVCGISHLKKKISFFKN